MDHHQGRVTQSGHAGMRHGRRRLRRVRFVLMGGTGLKRRHGTAETVR
jgi:hypothetical protein